MSDLYDLFKPKEPQAPQAFDKEAWAEKKKAEKSRCYAIIDASLERIGQDPELFESYLKVQSKFDLYSPRNALLIQAQKPFATKLADSNAWKEQGIMLKKFEYKNPVMILEPGNQYERADGSIGQSYNVKKLYDISQTMARIPPQESGRIDDRQLIAALITGAPVPVKPIDPRNGMDSAAFNPEEKCILVQRGLTPDEMFRGIARELAKVAILVEQRPVQDLAFTADAAAYMLCQQSKIEPDRRFIEELPKAFEGLEARDVGEALSAMRDTASDLTSRMAMNIRRQTKQKAAPAKKPEAR